MEIDWSKVDEEKIKENIIKLKKTRDATNEQLELLAKEFNVEIVLDDSLDLHIC